MQPRLKTSKKWTPLPDELMKQIQSVFSQGFKEETKGGKIDAGGRIFPEEILIRVGYKGPGTLRQKNWSISIAYKKNKDNVLKLLHLAVDAVGALFEQTFSAENDHDFPRLWDEVDFDGRQIFVQYSTDNTALESEADRLLGEADGGSGTDVAQGAWDDDAVIEPDTIKAALGIDPEEVAFLEEEEDEDPDEEPKVPKPSGAKKKATKH